MRRALLVALLVLAAVPSADAADQGAVFGLRAGGNPKLGYFVYRLQAGATKQGSVIVSNVGTKAGTVKLFVADGTTGQTSGTVYQTDRKPTEAGAWVSLGSSSVRLPPNGHRTVPFTVKVPSDAKPGQWVAGIVAETSHRVAQQKPGQKARVQIKIRDLTIVAVQVNVPGPRTVDFTVGDVTTGGTRGFQKLIVHVASDGNTLTKPRGAVTVYDSGGKALQTLPFQMDTFLPQTAIDYPILLKAALGAGSYQAAVRLAADGKTFTERKSFDVSSSDVKQVFTSAAPQAAPSTGSSSSSFPWLWIVVAAAAIVLLLALLLLLRRRRPEPPGETFERPLPPPVPGPSPAAEPSVPELPEPPPAAEQAPPPPPEPGCEEHYWDVAYERGVLGDDGVWRFPHRCRTCGREVLARDINDASEQAKGS